MEDARLHKDSGAGRPDVGTTNGKSNEVTLMKPDGSTSSPSQDGSNEYDGGRDETAVENTDFKRGIRFWAIIAGISVTSLQGSLENSVVVTAGPAIVDDLGMGEEYIWITNAFFLCW